MKPASGQARGTRSFLTIITVIAIVVIIAGLVGGIYMRQQVVVKEGEQLAPKTAETPAETDHNSIITTVPVPVETGSEASATPVQALSLLFPYGKEEFHPLKDYHGEGDIPQYHFNIDGSNKIYILGSLRLLGMLVIDPARKSSKILPLPIECWQFFAAFSPDIKNNSIYFLITQGVSKGNKVILARVEVTGTEKYLVRKFILTYLPMTFVSQMLRAIGYASQVIRYASTMVSSVIFSPQSKTAL